MPLQLKNRMLVIECCGDTLYFLDNHLTDGSCGYCAVCEKPLFIEINGHVYLIGEKVF